MTSGTSAPVRAREKARDDGCVRIRIQPRLMLATARAFVLLAVLPAAVFAQAEALSGHKVFSAL